MSETCRCSICYDLMDKQRHPELCVAEWSCCLDCWHKIQDYLTARGMTILQTEPSR